VEEQLIAKKRDTASSIAGIQGQNKHDADSTAEFHVALRIPFCWLNLRCLTKSKKLSERGFEGGVITEQFWCQNRMPKSLSL